MEMHSAQKNVLLIAMPFAGADIPSIQLGILEAYLKERNANIKTRHLYLKAAEFYNINNYNLLIYPPNDSYTAQMVFSKYVFPEHWKENKEKFKEYFNKTTAARTPGKQPFTFDDYVQRTDNFYNWILANADWRQYDIIGFTLNYGQFLPSLAVAKKIKELNPDKKIIFGGGRTVGNLGKIALESFPYVDFIVSGDGEEALYRLAYDYKNYESIPNLIYRKQNEIVWNQSENLLDLNSLPIPLYDSFYEELSSTSPEIQQFFCYNGKLPVEISRGCWWNKCTFCNLNIQHKKYREKNVNKIVEEIEFLSNKYKILNFQIISNNLLVKDHRVLCEKIKQLDKDFSFFAEARADHLNSDDYILLKEAGFNTIQTGIESFSSNYLRKMNKGARVIDNIAALKFCRENGIINRYNLIINYPNEETIDFEETKKTTELFKQYLDPPQICYLRVVYGSPIQCNPEQFNIERLEYAPIDTIMFPKEFLEKEFNFVYDFKRKEAKEEYNWIQLVEDWKKEREKLEIEGIKTQRDIDKFVFYFVDGENFLKIYDKRDKENIGIYVLDNIERRIFLSCIDIISFEELQERFPVVPDYQLAAILHTFEKNGIIYREDNSYLSLPLCHSLITKKSMKKEERQLLYTSGMKRNL
jgi:ribosomal peptide maturation radical SAM protein 1